MIKKHVILFFFTLVFSFEKININTANYDQLSVIPIENQKILEIIKFIQANGYIDNIYNLYDYEILTAKEVQVLKKYIVIGESDFLNLSKQPDLSYKVKQLILNEGSADGLSDILLDRSFSKSNVNYMTYDDLLSLPSLSPMDARAVLKQKDRGEIKGTFQLKNSPGISYYGYKNLRDFVSFGDFDKKKDLELVQRNKDGGIHKQTFRFSNLASSNMSYDGVGEDDIPVEYIPSSGNQPETLSKIFFSRKNVYDDKSNTPFIYSLLYLTSPWFVARDFKEGLKTSLKSLTYSFGALRNNNLGDLDYVYNKKLFFSIDSQIKGNKDFYNTKLIFGNFNASFGQGVVFSSGDSYRPRTTGYGFSKKQLGISYDLSRSHQLTLNGIAAQVSISDEVVASFFYSFNNNKRDAIINEDGSFSSFITMKPRLGYGYTNNKFKPDPTVTTEAACISAGSLYEWDNNTSTCYKIYIHENMINSVEEQTIGGNFTFNINKNLYFGFTLYESMYDRVLDPQILESVVGGSSDDFGPEFDASNDWDDYSGDGNFAVGYMSNSADPEIRAMYSNSGSSTIWSDAKSYRRVAGWQFTKIWKNMSIQGEYGELIISGERNPKAYVVNTYMQFDNLNFLVLYRDYDLHYDNPYQKSFSEYRRYKSTIFEDAYWLEDPVFYNLYSANSQPQAERGYYIESRYQFHEDLIAGIQWDVWTRKADEARYFRIVNKLEWRPAFNYRIYFRYKLQSRGSHDIAHPSPYFTKEARIRFKLRLSNYDYVEFLYSWNYTTFSPRPRLTGNSNALGGDMTQGDIGTPESSIGFMFSHNFSKYVNMKAGVVYADGFLWYIEDNDFKLFDTNDGIFHSWLSFVVNPTNEFSINFKVSKSSDYPSTKIVEGQEDSGSWILNPLVLKQNVDWKIQLSYAI